MEWKKNPSDDALEKSGNNDGYGNDTSREARDFSMGGRNFVQNKDTQAPEQEGQPRRRRRISEMSSNLDRGYRDSDDYQRRPRREFSSYEGQRSTEYEYGYDNNRQSREEHNFYKEKYNQVRESHRQRYDRTPTSSREECSPHSREEQSNYQDRRPHPNSERRSYPNRGGGYQSDRRRAQTDRDRSPYERRSSGVYQDRDNYSARRDYQSNRDGASYDRRNDQSRDNYQSDRRGFQPYRRDGQSERRREYPNREGAGNPQDRNYQNRDRSNRYPDNRRQNNRYSNQRNNQQGVRTAPIYEDQPFDQNEEIRLNKFLSNSGVCSRREADELIKAGAVLVNGVPVTELGVKITLEDHVQVNGKEVKPENKVYVLLNKPRNCVTTTDDPQERLTVMHLVRKACNERIYPVGRLDRNTTGVLLLTNDGELASKLVHPSFKKKKIYHVWLDKEVSIEDMQAIANGIELEDGEMHADAISYAAEDDRTQVGIEIHSGRNRIVRRIFEHLGYHVTKLDRVYFAGLTKKNLGRGKWRYLTQEEVNNLKMGAFE